MQGVVRTLMFSFDFIRPAFAYFETSEPLIVEDKKCSTWNIFSVLFWTILQMSRFQATRWAAEWPCPGGYQGYDMFHVEQNCQFLGGYKFSPGAGRPIRTYLR